MAVVWSRKKSTEAPELGVADTGAGPDPATSVEAEAAAGLGGVYEFLVEAEDDVVGLVSYALYKREKRDWLLNWRAQNAYEPTPAQFDAFLAANLTLGQRERYREAARHVLGRFQGGAIGLPGAGAAEMSALRIEAAAGKLERMGRTSRLFFSGAFGGLMMAILVAVAGIVLLRMTGYDLPAAINALIPVPPAT